MEVRVEMAPEKNIFLFFLKKRSGQHYLINYRLKSTGRDTFNREQEPRFIFFFFQRIEKFHSPLSFVVKSLDAEPSRRLTDEHYQDIVSWVRWTFEKRPEMKTPPFKRVNFCQPSVFKTIIMELV
jgi:hypothetical protein